MLAASPSTLERESWRKPNPAVCSSLEQYEIWSQAPDSTSEMRASMNSREFPVSGDFLVRANAEGNQRGSSENMTKRRSQRSAVSSLPRLKKSVTSTGFFY